MSRQKFEQNKAPFWKQCINYSFIVQIYAWWFTDKVNPVWKGFTEFHFVLPVGILMMLFGITLGVLSFLARRKSRQAEKTSDESEEQSVDSKELIAS